jgi:hypothetical protein
VRAVVVASLAAGCSTSLSVGGEGITTARSVHSATAGSSQSAEAVVAGGVGVAGVGVRLEGSIGESTRGGVQGKLLAGDEVAWFGKDCDGHPGWQGRVMGGGSFRAEQSQALAEAAVGLRWDLDCKMDAGVRRASSITLDAIVGYAFRDRDGQGVLFGLALGYRFDTVGSLRFNQ